MSRKVSNTTLLLFAGDDGGPANLRASSCFFSLPFRAPRLAAECPPLARQESPKLVSKQHSARGRYARHRRERVGRGFSIMWGAKLEVEVPGGREHRKGERVGKIPCGIRGTEHSLAPSRPLRVIIFRRRQHTSRDVPSALFFHPRSGKK